MTRILILQTNLHAIMSIRALIEQERFDTVFLTDEYDDLIQQVKRADPRDDLIVITSDYLGSRHADDVARETKSLHLRTKVFTYTVMAATRMLIDGRIPKIDRQGTILRPFLREVYDNGYDEAKIRATFPRIEFTKPPAAV